MSKFEEKSRDVLHPLDVEDVCQKRKSRHEHIIKNTTTREEVILAVFKKQHEGIRIGVICVKVNIKAAIVLMRMVSKRKDLRAGDAAKNAKLRKEVTQKVKQKATCSYRK